VAKGVLGPRRSLIRSIVSAMEYVAARSVRHEKRRRPQYAAWRGEARSLFRDLRDCPNKRK